jgi:PAS domain S-box-containing protein
MKRSFQWNLALAFGTALTILALVAALSFTATFRIKDTHRTVAESHKLRDTIARARTLIFELETSQRGFLLSARENFAASYADAKTQLGEVLKDLKNQTQSRPAQRVRVNVLERRLTERFEWLDRFMEIQRKEGPEGVRAAAQPELGQGQRQAIRQTLVALETEEDNLLRRKQAEAESRIRDDLASSLCLVILDLAVLMSALILVRRHMNHRLRAEEELKRSNDQLEHRIAVRTRALADANAALRGEVAQRQKVEENLRASEEQFRGVFRHAAVGIMVTNLDGAWVEVNPRLGEILGRSPSSLLGAYLEDFAHPEDQTGARELDHSLLAGLVDGYDLEKRLRHEKGHDVWVRLSTSVLRAASGNPQGRISVVEDITARKEAEEALRHSERHLREILDGLTAYVTVLAPDGTVVQANRAALDAAGLRSRDVVGKAWVNTSSWTYAPAAQERIARAIKRATQGELQRFDIAMRTANGRFLILDLAVAPMYGEAGRVIYLIASGADITSRKRVEEENRRLNESLERRVRERTTELEEANRELEAFSFSVSHDLRAPVRHIGGYADLLARRCASALDGPGLRYLETIRDAARGAGVLIDNLLALSRMGRTAVRRVEVNMDELAAEARRDVEPEADGRSITWKIQPLPNVQGDPALLRLALRNLLSNAVKYTRGCPDAQIEISAEVQEHEAIFRVRDNGAGFDMKYADRLFGVFQRLHTAEEFEGTGVGLANVRRIISRHGGRTGALGAVAQGAVFFFTLPLPEADTPAQDTDSQPDTAELVGALKEETP